MLASTISEELEHVAKFCHPYVLADRN